MIQCILLHCQGVSIWLQCQNDVSVSTRTMISQIGANMFIVVLGENKFINLLCNLHRIWDVLGSHDCSPYFLILFYINLIKRLIEVF